VTSTKTKVGPHFFCANNSSAVNDYRVTTNAALTNGTVADGTILTFEVASATNTAASTFKADTMTARNLVKQFNVALAAGDLRLGQMVSVMWDASTTTWQLISPVGNPDIRHAAAISADGLAYTAPSSPTLTALTNGARVVVVWATTNTGAVTFALDSLAPKAVRKLNDQALVAGDLLANQFSFLVYDSTLDHWLMLSPVTINTPATVVGLSRGLVCKVNATNPTYQADITADDVVLKNASDLSYLASSVSLTVAISSSGANGLDTGAEASPTWYYLWVIYNGSTVAGLISASSTAPTLPSGYTYKALVGAVFNNSGSDFTRFWQTGRRVQLAPANIFTAKAATGADTYQALTGGEATLLAAAVPPIAKTVLLTAGASTTQNSIAVAGDTNGVGSIVSAGDVAGATTVSSFVGCSSGEVPLITAQTVVWKSGSTNAYNRLDVNGYTI